jgi:diguanylate cyclase (GGDEF)-like protein
LLNARHRLADDVHRHLRSAVIAFALIGLPLAALLTRAVIQSSLSQQSHAAMQAGRMAARELDHELVLREHAVEALVANAEQVMKGRVTSPVEVVGQLRARPNQGGYTLGIPPGYAATEICSLMGEGPVPARGSATVAEMQMAIALTPSFLVLRDRGLEIPWAYYVSRRGFLYICPRAGEDVFLWSHDLLDRYTNPSGTAILRTGGRRLVWSTIYRDTAGKGLMTTLSGLVVDRGAVIGDVSIDLGVATLFDRLARHGLPDSTLHLLAADGTDMLGRAALPGRIDPRVASRAAPVRVGGAEVALRTVRTTGWHVAVVTPRRAMLLRALRESTVYGLLVVFLLASLALLFALANALRTLAALSVRDPLTGVYNRRHFDACMRIECSKVRRVGTRFGVAMLDIDHFKVFNDRYGHHAGDQALRAVAKALGASLQRLSDQPFRIGGEEFAVIAHVERDDQMERLGEKLCAAIRALAIPHAGSPQGVVTISVGATIVDGARGVDPERAYQQADAALYRAKEAGRDRVVPG